MRSTLLILILALVSACGLKPNFKDEVVVKEIEVFEDGEWTQSNDYQIDIKWDTLGGPDEVFKVQNISLLIVNEAEKTTEGYYFDYTLSEQLAQENGYQEYFLPEKHSSDLQGELKIISELEDSANQNASLLVEMKWHGDRSTGENYLQMDYYGSGVLILKLKGQNYLRAFIEMGGEY